MAYDVGYHRVHVGIPASQLSCLVLISTFVIISAHPNLVYILAPVVVEIPQLLVLLLECAIALPSFHDILITSAELQVFSMPLHRIAILELQ